MWAYTYSDELYHHGIKGQKWGVRRFQNKDGSLTKEGLERLKSNKEISVAAGVKLGRVGDKENDSGKKKGIYVTADAKERDKYILTVGAERLEKGKVYMKEYIHNEDLNIPSVKVQNQLAKKVMKDEDVRKEIADTMASKGYTEDTIKRALDRHSAGKEFIRKTLVAAGAGAALGMMLADGSDDNRSLLAVPIGGLIGAASMITYGVANRTNMQSRSLAMRSFYNSIGDDRNSAAYKKYSSALKEKGYNAVRDLNDKHNLMNSHSAIIIMNSSNLEKKNQEELTRDKYIESAVRQYKKMHPSITRDDSLNDIRKSAGKMYDGLIEARKNSKKDL